MLVVIPKDIEGKDFLCRIQFSPEQKPAEAMCSLMHKGKSDKDLYRVGFFFAEPPVDFEKGLTSLIRRSIFPPK